MINISAIKNIVHTAVIAQTIANHIFHFYHALFFNYTFTHLHFYFSIFYIMHLYLIVILNTLLHYSKPPYICESFFGQKKNYNL